jgi:hypothetical protein
MFLNKANEHPLPLFIVMVRLNQNKKALIIFIVLGMQGNQQFVYDLKHYHILHVASQLCLDCDLNSKLIYMEQCDIQSLNQKWKFSSYNDTLILKEMKQFFF